MSPLMRCQLVAALGAVFGLGFGSAAAQSRDAPAAGRDIHAKWQQAVVTARLVIKTRVVVGGREMQTMEDQVEVPGTVIDPAGLTVVALSGLNPGEALKRFMPQMGPDSPKVEFETTPSDVKLRLADGQEIAARVALRDTDLDLAFLKPVDKPASALRAVDMTQTSTPQLLDEVVVLSRLGRVAGWQAAVSLDRIQAVIETPRRFYVPSGSGQLGGTGTPVFSLDGKLVGLLLLRIASENRPSMMSFAGGPSGMGMIPVVLPAADVKTVASQALAK